MFKVIATPGVTARYPDNGKGNPKGFSDLTQAEAAAKVCNLRAEKLGIKTRYMAVAVS